MKHVVPENSFTFTQKLKKLQYTIWGTTHVGNAQTQRVHNRSEDLKQKNQAKLDLQSMTIEEIAACIEVGDMEGADEEADYWE